MTDGQGFYPQAGGGGQEKSRDKAQPAIGPGKRADLASQRVVLHDQHGGLSHEGADGGAGGLKAGDQEGVEDEVDDDAGDLGLQDDLFAAQGHEDLHAEDVGEADEEHGGHDEAHRRDGAEVGVAGQDQDALRRVEHEVEGERRGEHEDEAQRLLGHAAELVHLAMLHVVAEAGQQHGAEGCDDADEDRLDLHSRVVVAHVHVGGHEAQHQRVQVRVDRRGAGHAEEDHHRLDVPPPVAVPGPAEVDVAPGVGEVQKV